MADKTAFTDLLKQAYTFKGESFRAGTAMLGRRINKRRRCSYSLTYHEPPWTDRGRNRNR